MSGSLTKEDLTNLITEQGDAIRVLKKESPANKEQIAAAVGTLKSLKDQYMALTGKEYGAPPSGSSGSQEPKQPQGPSKKDLRKAQRLAEQEAQKKEKLDALERLRAEEDSNDYAKESYGADKLVRLSSDPPIEYTQLSNITDDHAGKTVTIRARLHNTRLSGQQCFMELRERDVMLQAILAVNPTTISKPMLRFVGSIPIESIVRIKGVLTVPPSPIVSCSISMLELAVTEFFVVSRALPTLPFSLANASAPIHADDDGMTSETAVETTTRELAGVNIDTRLDNRIIDLRTPANQAILSLKSRIDMYFRAYMTSQGFREIHTPKLLGAASEGGANVFKATYFNTSAYLAQSPQLYKQMSICADMGRVFEVGPVFRAENSNTHRHLTEFTGYDFEMELYNHYHELTDVIDGLFRYIFRNIRDHCQKELVAYSQQYPFEPLKFHETTLRMNYADGIKLLNEAGVEMDPLEDLSTTNEKHLGRLIREKYDCDFYILDKFPLHIRPFYTMPCPENPDLSNSFDAFIRGEEILSGSQRVHDPAMLEERALSKGVDLSTIQSYIDAFRYGAPAHGGSGLGAERILMLYLGCQNIRRISMFPRDPKRLFP